MYGKRGGLKQTQTNQFVGEHSGRNNFYALNGFTEIRTKIAFVTREQMRRASANGSCQNGNVLGRQFNIKISY